MPTTSISARRFEFVFRAEQSFRQSFLQSAEADFATQRDVSRRKRDIRTIVLKVRLDNPNDAYVPGMTADVLVSQSQLRGTNSSTTAAASEHQP